MMLNPQTIWWKSITGPVRLVNEVINRIFDGQSLVIINCADFAWRSTFRYEIESALIDDAYLVNFVDCRDDYDGSDPANYLLERYGKEKVLGYKRHKMTEIQYMLANKILSNKVIWIKSVPVDIAQRWMDFCSIWAGKGKTDGQLVVEIDTNTVLSPPPPSKRFAALKDSEFISDNDTHTFASLLASRTRSQSPLSVHYAAQLCANLFGTDSESVAAFLRDFDVVIDDPVIKIQNMYRDEFAALPRGSENNPSGSQHPFYCIKTNNIDELEYRIWKAQLRIVYPQIEAERILFIRKYQSLVESCMPDVDQYDAPLSTPFDVELGTLCFMTKPVNGMKRLIIANHEDNNRLFFIKKLRNALAHRDICTPTEIESILSGHVY